MLQSNLADELRAVARHLRAVRLHRRGMVRWLVIAAISYGLLEARASFPAFAPYGMPLLALTLLAGIAHSVYVSRREKLNFIEAARIVEVRFPELKQALRTAAEQTPGKDGQFNFLQLRVIGVALQHANVNDWRKKPRQRAQSFFAGHAFAFGLALAFTLLPLLLLLGNKEFPVAKLFHPGFTVAVTPGNEEIERGSTVVVGARIEGHLFRDVALTWRQADGKTGVIAMPRSLSDPVYMATLNAIAANVTYSVTYGNTTTENYTLKVFDQPALVKADATLDYPSYTGLAKKTIQDTRRVSAIQGTKLEYDFTMNKPMKDASLQDANGTIIPLTPSNPEHTLFSANMTIDHSEQLALHLTDDDGRTNPLHTDIRIDALPNQKPVVRITFPQRDPRVSPIEEVHLQADAKSQFDMIDYGIAYSIDNGEPQYISLMTPDAKSKTQATFGQTIDLEPKNLTPGDLVTWFAWADDHGPDGATRHTTSSLAFAEVRPFEMIYHEEDAAPTDAGGGGGGGGGAASEDLIQLEQQISIAIWNLKQEDKPDKDFAANITTLKTSQEEAITQLASQADSLTTPLQQAAAKDAAKFMQQADDNLATAATKNALDPLDPAWTGAQGAYQSLLRMEAREFRVAQQRQGSGQGQQQNQRLQSQLNQLQFRNQQNRYQSQNTPTPQDQRQQLDTQSNLRDLARRQQDVNQRLQELQTALAAAQDQTKRDQIQSELKRLEDEQRSMLADLDSAQQSLDQAPANQQNQQARQQLDQARENMRQAGDQLAQNQVSQALASGTRANQALQQSEQNLRSDSTSQFSDQLAAARQEARDLANQQQQDGKQLDQLAQNASQSLDDSAARQTLAQSYTQQSTDLNKLMDQLRQITDDSEQTEPTLHKNLYDTLRAQGNSTAATNDDLKNGAELLRNGFVNQTQPLQKQAAQNLDQLRQSIDRALGAVLGDDATALRFAQNELSDLAQQAMREQPANSEQFRADSTTPAGQNGQPGQPGANGQNQNPSGTAQGQPGQTGQGNRGAQVAQNGTGDGFRQGQTQQPGQNPGGQQGDQGQGQGRQGDTQTGNGQVAQNGTGQPQTGNGQAQGARGQGNPQGQGTGQGDQQTAQNDNANGQGAGQGRQAGNQRGQGNGQGEIAQGGPNGQGGQGNRGQGTGQQGQGQASGQNDQQLAQDDTNSNPTAQGNGQGRQGGGRQGQASRAAGNGQVAQGNGQRQGNGAQGQPGDAQGNGQVAQNDSVDQTPDDAAAGGPVQGGNRRGGQRGAQRGNGGQAGGLGGGFNNLGGPGGYNNGVLNGNATYNGTADLQGPITGGNFTGWADRLRVVENLVDDPQLRQQIANARAQAEDMRRDFTQHSNPPQWDMILSNVITPLNKASTELHQELARREQPDALQPVDQDPVPDQYADSVKKYYEALGN